MFQLSSRTFDTLCFDKPTFLSSTICFYYFKKRIIFNKLYYNNLKKNEKRLTMNGGLMLRE